jgi:hypothetical protein
MKRLHFDSSNPTRNIWCREKEKRDENEDSSYRFMNEWSAHGTYRLLYFIQPADHFLSPSSNLLKPMYIPLRCFALLSSFSHAVSSDSLTPSLFETGWRSTCGSPYSPFACTECSLSLVRPTLRTEIPGTGATLWPFGTSDWPPFRPLALFERHPRCFISWRIIPCRRTCASIRNRTLDRE